MYTKPVGWLTIGDVLAKDVKNNGEIIFKKGTVLEAWQILKLQYLNIRYVTVQSVPFLNQHDNCSNYPLKTNLTQKAYFDFIIRKNNNNRYYYFIENAKIYSLLTKLLEHITTSDSVENLLSVLKLWDIYGYEHAVDVFTIGSIWLDHIGVDLDPEYGTGFLLHDIGKIKIPREILLKRGDLQEEEYDLLKMHTHYGAELLKNMGFSKIISDMALYHHVRFDNSGYPEMSPNELPTAIRALMIVDVFSALTLERPYRKAFSFREGLDLLQENSGAYDQQLLENFVEFIEEKIKYKMVTGQKV